ncbi:MAG: superoxide dismutase [Bryobacterales bacterium]|nr:superoxide dismutase [Bryobacterales bacterium]
MERRLFLGGLATVAVRAQAAPGPHQLPKLPCAVDALEPFIDAKTMEIHHGKHHQAYVDNLNKALAGQPALAKMPLDTLLAQLDKAPEGIRTALRNHGGGHANHSLFWNSLGKGSPVAKGALAKAIEASFGSQKALEEKLRAGGAGVFGSGWVWLVLDRAGKLAVETSPNQDSPLMTGKRPVVGIDVWEHAYYLKYQNRRPDYLAAILQVLHWDSISQRYEELSRG